MKTMKRKNREEVLEVFMTPEMTEEQRQENLEAFRAFRQQAEDKQTSKQRLKARLLQLKYLMEDYLKTNALPDFYDFSFFLQEYINRLDRKNKEFADEINVPETLLSQIINKHRKPNEEFIIRLELHSNKNFPAIMWYRVLEKEREFELMNDMKLRREQSKHVKRRLEFSI